MNAEITRLATGWSKEEQPTEANADFPSSNRQHYLILCHRLALDFGMAAARRAMAQFDNQIANSLETND